MKSSKSQCALCAVVVSSVIETAVMAAPGPDVQGVVRSIDGRGNNFVHTDWGAAESELLRRLRVAYTDGRSSPAGATRPSARAISNVVASQTEERPNRRGATDMLWQWGQFLDHDIDHTSLATPAEPFAIPVPRGDRWFDPNATGAVTIRLNRSKYELVGPLRIRQQINSITAFIDASNVYGSDATRATALRGVHGTLLTSAGNLLPFNTAGLSNAPSNDARFFLAGDERANEQVGLIAMHTLFVREHNRIVAALLPLGLPADANYEVARALVAAEMQAITYREFLPMLLGRDALREYRGYRADVDPSIANSFSTAAYRLGHSMLSPTLRRLDARGDSIAAGDLPLRSAFFAPEQVLAYGVEPLLRGLCAQRAQELDVEVIDDVRNFLFGAPGSGGFDLAALNIQRGRDHGLPSYNDARRDLGLRPARRFEDLTRDRDVQRRLRDAYGDVESIDLWVGGLAEAHVDDGMVGEVFRRILVDQFERLRDGDRFYYERYLPPEWVSWVEQQTLARIIRNNTSIGAELPDDVFAVGRRR